MKFSILPNGNLELKMTRGDKGDIKEMVEKNPNDLIFMAELLEHTGWSPNGHLYQLKPEDIAALTEAPILTDDVTIEDDGSVTVPGNVWWYPSYALWHFGEELLKEGRVEFTAAPTVPESAHVDTVAA